MKLHFKISLTLAIAVVIVAFSAMTLLNIRLLTSDAGQDAADQLFHLVAENVENEIDHVIGQSYNNVSVLASLPEPETLLDVGVASAAGQVMLNILREYPALYSAYVGFEDNGFFQVIAAHGDPAILARHRAPSGTVWIARTIDGDGAGGRRQNWVFYDRKMMPVDTRIENDGTWLPYFPNQRPWYQAAQEAKRAVLSDAYIFHSSKEPGITASRRLQYGNGIAGIDLTLSSLETFLVDLSLSPNGQVMIVDASQRVIAHAPVAPDVVPLQSATKGLPGNLGAVLSRLDGRDGVSKDVLVHTRKVALPGSSLDVGIVAPFSDFLGTFEALKERVVIASLVGLFAFLPLTLMISGRMSRRLMALVVDARRIRHLDFTGDDRPVSRIIEFNELEDNFISMRDSLQDHSRQLRISQDKLNRLVELGIAMSSEKDNDKVMDMLLQGARELSNADGGTLYLIEDEALAFQIVLNESLGLRKGGLFDEDPDLPAVPLFKEDGSANRNNVVSQAVHAATTIHIPDVYANQEYNFSGTRTFDELHGYHSKSFLTVPLKPRGGNVIGAIQILNPQDEDGKITGFDEETTRFIEALSAQAATVLHNRDLVAAQEELMDSLIQLIGGAIDTKSPYTGGHCERVPELAMMLAREASDSNDGVMADFRFNSQEEWREFSIGAWLHDCGKVVTPEYVVDKATKLETIYNRIHEIRTRFEVLLRDEEITCLKAIAAGGDEKELRAIYETEKALLIDDFAFVAECNIGGEFMADDKITRLKGIAARYWVRNFDIRLGLSHEEEPFYTDAPTGPVPEPLLDDKSWHVVPRRRNVKDQYAELGFKTPVPEHLYNRGEVYNLSVQRGTLTEEERFKINEHIMQTIAMLERLPFPDHLKRVPEYAGTHHETLTGSGYPRQLDERDLSVPARVMAIADIFEALTASDRPYKKAKTLSEAVRILSFFKKDRHIDGELFDLFLTSGVYLEYAKKFLTPDQIDDVEISQYLG